MPEGRRGSVIFSPDQPERKPVGMVDAISEIQQYYIIEKTGQDIPPEFLTYRGVMTFFSVGFKSGFIEGFLLALLLPFAWGVWEGKIPVFDGIQKGLFTRLYIFLLSFGISLSYVLLFGVILAQYYIGNLTRRAIDSLAWGRATSLSIKGILIFIVYCVLVRFWTPENVWTLAGHMRYLGIDNSEAVYYKVMLMKHPVWLSGWTQLFTSPLLSVIPLLCLKLRKRKSAG